MVDPGVKYVKRNALAGRRFAGLEELNAYLLSWCVDAHIGHPTSARKRPRR